MRSRAFFLSAFSNSRLCPFANVLTPSENELKQRGDAPALLCSECTRPARWARATRTHSQHDDSTSLKLASLSCFVQLCTHRETPARRHVPAGSAAARCSGRMHITHARTATHAPVQVRVGDELRHLADGEPGASVPPLCKHHQRALSVTQRALSVTQRARSITQRALSVTQQSQQATVWSFVTHRAAGCSTGCAGPGPWVCWAAGCRPARARFC
jgi:hypothetical protein